MSGRPTSRQRFLTAMLNQIPDRVPATPDISNMVPCRLTGKPFWQVYYLEDPPLWRAYLDAARYYGIDPWFVYADMRYQYANRKTTAAGAPDRHQDYWQVRYRHVNSAGERFSTTRFWIADSPARVEFPIHEIRADMDWIRAEYSELPLGFDASMIELQRAEVGSEIAFGIAIDYPGLQNWIAMVEGGLERLVHWVYDEPGLIEEWRQMMHRKMIALTQLILQAKPDYILLNGSGTITLQSPALARKLSLPTVQEITRLARAAGVPTMLHSCGKEQAWIRMCAEETDLNCINPLETPPMGDCTLAEVKRKFGRRIALMGNLHTTTMMLQGTPGQVEAACRQAIEDAGENGGFILSTGDQCGRDTPDANLFAMVEAAQKYGKYRG